MISHFSDCPIAPFSHQFAFQDSAYQSKVANIDENIQKRVKNYETQFEGKRGELEKEQTKIFEQKQKLFQTIGSVVGQALGFTAGLLLSWNNADTRPFMTYTCTIVSLYAGHLAGSEVGKRVATLPPLETQEWKSAVCSEEVDGLVKEWFEVVGLATSLEVRDATHPDLPKLTQLEKLMHERIGKIRDIAKQLLAKDSADLNPTDDIDLTIQATKGINSSTGIAAIPKVPLPLVKGEKNKLTILKRSALILSISTLFEKCVPLLFLEPLTATGGMALGCALLYLGRREIVHMKDDFQNTSPVCKLVIVAYPILGGTAPLFILKNYVPSLTHVYIMKCTTVVMATFSRLVQLNKREIDSYYLRDKNAFMTPLVQKEEKEFTLKAKIDQIKFTWSKIGELMKLLLFLRGVEAKS